MRGFISGSLLLGGLLIASVGLYALDIYATARIDEFLLSHYGPELYDRYTTTFDPNQDDQNFIRFSATTEKEYYGYRSLYGLKILGWLAQAQQAYGAAKEVLASPICQKSLRCVLKSTPKEDQTWLATKLASLYHMLYHDDQDSNDLHQLGRQDICQKKYPGCHQLEKYIY